MTDKLKYVLVLTFALILSSPVFSQIPDDIILSIKSGNASKLSEHFNQNIELVVLDNENVYSKAHAKQVVESFFKKYPPDKFNIMHQGGKPESKYAIGTLTCKNDKFRVYFLIKQRNNSNYIHQLRIEKQSN